MLLPQISLADTHVTRPTVRDAALQAGGTLQGSLLSPDGKAQTGRTVQLLSRGEVVASTQTDREGRFAFRGLRAGVYGLHTDGVAIAYRLWADGAAPPSAVSDVLLVSGQEPIVRGAIGDHFGGHLGKPLLLGGLLGAAGVIGGVIGYNIRDFDPAS
ncbi:MAG: hypothetical protein CMJ62_12945 [Planctomycetaceae bacterium]|nr:hypothetical protein [Planctomycetaceae bacterium]